ncbi:MULTISPECIES: hypothetical protein [Paenibacillus]|uniref:hypothetical protein n=1 Tax=Paenibacillus TaxID=44249 RepID=UPI00041F8B59|nr:MULTISPECIES: hypothetical protein [Paenibacillus]KGP77412.1 hypothetical protein P364_0133140 [Paenibacillus sp. MAEPY2]KGP79371.1 hypothetical protein P363_0131130 [Paenibacillus sp. MAEPY1]OZQ60183.1 hypothetical protein CA599_30830 [Paenibacillus taichungensis]
MFTVNDVMELTDQRRGTVDNFRSELQKLNLMSNNERFDKRALETFRKAIEFKEENDCTWIHANNWAIQMEYAEEMSRPFEWSTSIHFKYLTYLNENHLVDVKHIVTDLMSTIDFFAVFHVIIDNFKDMGAKYNIYKASQPTDGNALAFKCKGDDFFYYVVGKYNYYTKEEDVHVFYNDGLVFNIMKCQYIGGGRKESERLKDLVNSVYESYNSKKTEEKNLDE